MLKNFIEGVKDVLPAIGGTIGYAVAGPAGAAIGSGIGSFARGDEGDEALKNALIAGGIGYGGQKFLAGGSGPLGQFFSQGTIPGVVGGDAGILKSFGERSFSPGMTSLGFGGKYLPTEQAAASRMIGGKEIYDPLRGGMRTGIGSGTEVSGATLKEFDALKALGTGDSDEAILSQAKKNVLSGDTIAKEDGIMSKFLSFAKTNPELLLGGSLLLDKTGFFEEGGLESLPRSVEIGSQGSLPTGMATLIQPVAGEGGLFSYNMAKDGGIMHAKDGEQAELSEEDQKILTMLRSKAIGAAEGKMMDGSIDNFEENSPRRDLFLEREGPISDDRGSPNKDTVYAKLADGEFVVNADTVADIGYGMGARNLADAKDLGGSFFYGLQDAQKKGILGNMVGTA
jgi:hypothetical protein